MNLEELRDALARADVRLSRSGDELVVRSERGVIDTELQTALRHFKKALLAILPDGGRSGPPADGGEIPHGVPPNAITPETRALTPTMLPLIDLGQADIDTILATVPGGLANVQDIYALSPMQEGMLFHHMLATEGDPYLIVDHVGFESRELLDRYVDALRRIIDRHDILRTAFVWEGLSTPAQVVWRRARLDVEELALAPDRGPAAQQLARRFDPRHHRIDLTQAPLMHLAVAHDIDSGRWHLVQRLHHLIDDIASLQTLHAEVHAILDGRAAALPAPRAFRNLIARARASTGTSDHAAYFRRRLGDVDEPSAPFGLTDVHLDGSSVTEARLRIEPSLERRLREAARRQGVGMASLCHLAWGLVQARACARDTVVFGTVLSGRAGAGAEGTLGLFINTLPLRLDLGRTGVGLCLQETHAALAELLAHELAPLTLAQRCSGVEPPRPLFTTMFNYRHDTQLGAPGRIPAGMQWLGGEERTNYPLSVSVEDHGDGLGLSVQAVRPIAASAVLGHLQQALASLADALEAAPGRPACTLEILPRVERELLLDRFNRTASPFPAHRCVHHLFEDQAARTPHRTALQFGAATLDYAALDRHANRLAHRLIAAGIVPDTPVAICAARGPALLIGMLATWKAGGAYVPLDPAHHSQRSIAVLADAGVRVVLADPSGREALGAGALADRLVIDPSPEKGLDETDPAGRAPIVDGLNSGHLAYLIYTSGSTGAPKGVMVEHRSLVNHLVWQTTQFGFDRHDVFLHRSSPAFDAAGWEIWTPLTIGARLVLLPEALVREPRALSAQVRRHGLTVLQVVPSMLDALTDDSLAPGTSLRFLFCGGEALSPALLARARAWAGCDVVNLYGPTEATIDSTAWLADTVPTDLVPIGRPIANARIHLLDAHGQLVPLGAVGEIHIGGAGVARGYLNQPELTAERFLPDPFSPLPQARMFRSGDLGRYLPDGSLLFLGRNDRQLKLRGHRIEPAEIEAGLRTFPGVREAVVVPGADAQGELRLLAYVVADPNSELPALLHAHLAARLPTHMVPAAFVRLEAFPLTLHGKLDRTALPAPDDDAFVHDAYVAPRGEIETAIATLWSELLGVARVGRHDNFFALGGHSLLALRSMERLRRLQLAGSVRDLFDKPVLMDFATTLAAPSDARVPPNGLTVHSTALTPDMLPLIDLTQDEIDHVLTRVPGGLANLQDVYALSPLQDGILFHHLSAPEGDPYLLVSQLAFADRPLLDRYLAALQQVVDRHDILRTAFVWEGLAAPAQVVWRHAPLQVDCIELDENGIPGHAQLAARFDSRHHRIDLGRPPLLRCTIASDPGSTRWLLAQRQHHLIGDHETLHQLVEEVTTLMTTERIAPAAAPVARFRDLIAQVKNEAPADHERYFHAALGDVEEPTEAFGPMGGGDGTGSADAEMRRLPRPTSDGLRSQARRLGVSVASLCHLAWALVLCRGSARTDVVFGTVLLGRLQVAPAAHRALGPYINTLPLRLRLSGAGAAAAVHLTQAALAELLCHEHASLVSAQRCSGVRSPTPLFSTLLNYRHDRSQQELSAHPVVGIEWLGAQERTHYDVTVSVEDDGDTLGLSVQTAHSLSAEHVTRYMQQALEGLATALDVDPARPVLDIDILPPDELSLLLHGWNHTPPAEAAPRCLHELFEEQARRRPEAIALVFDGGTLRYGELDADADRLARRLVAQGVGPDRLVAVCAARGPALIVALLAILKAGGAYVPLDPAHACARLTEVLHDAQPVVLLVDAAGREALGTAALEAFRWLALDRPEADDPARASPDARARGLTPRHLAYVIYTSGSTGKPKGVMVEHAQVVRLLTTTLPLFDFGPDDVWCLFHSIAFDFSVWELWGALCHGARLVLVPQACAQDAAALHRLVAAHGVTVLNQTPGAFQAFAEADRLEPRRLRLRHLIFGGEALAPATLADWVGRHPDPVPRLSNLYGITETTVHATHHALTAGDVGRPGSPIGRRLADLRLYLLDPRGRPVPLGAVGEIYIGGAGVARGYLNQPELTAERFLPDPFSPLLQARMFRSGDLGRYLPDGSLLFLGRNDRQLKLRGHRIEPAEIEAGLRAFPGVREAVVVPGADAQGELRLLAYVVADPNSELPALLHAHLAARLPTHMVPAAFVRLDAFPLTLHGKLDRAALPAPDDDALVQDAYVAPRGEIETAIATLWSELLGVARVGRHDNFFALGGHSLLALRSMERLRRLQLAGSVRDLFDKPVLADFATTLAAPSDARVPPNGLTVHSTALTPDMLPLIDLTQDEIDHVLTRVPGGLPNLQDVYALSPLQDGILFHHLSAPEGDPYLLVSQLAFADRPLLDRYLAALQQVVDRHDILRTAFVWEGLAAPAQVVWRHAPLQVDELRLDPRDGPVTRQLARHLDPRRHRIDLGRAPLIRFTIAHDPVTQRWLCGEQMHHLIDDASSLQRLHQEVRALMAGRPAELGAPRPFRELVARVRASGDTQEHIAYFRGLLGDFDTPTQPFGLGGDRRPEAALGEVRLAVPPDLVERLRVQARRLEVSLASLCHLGWGLVLGRCSGRDDVVFGTVLVGRMEAAHEAGGALGLFINTLPVRLDVGNVNVAASARGAHRQLAELLRREHASLVLAQRCSAVAAPTPVFSALLNYRHPDRRQAADPMWTGIDGVERLAGGERTHYPFTLSIDDHPDALDMTVQVASPVSARRVAGYMVQALLSLVEALASGTGSTLGDLQVLPAPERNRLLQTWNRSACTFPDALCVPGLFAMQARRHPAAKALVMDDLSLSYADLEAASGALAGRLMNLGVGPETRVALCVERRPSLVIALLAILRAGGACVPLDPAYPCARLTQVLANARPLLLFADAVGRDALGATALQELQVLDPDSPMDDPTGSAVSPSRSAAAPIRGDQLAQLLYTSGSTGRPKGVMIEQRHLCNALRGIGAAIGMGPTDRVLAISSVAFDIAAVELLLPLCTGACVVLAGTRDAGDPGVLRRLLRHRRITVMQATPTIWRSLIATGWEPNARLMALSGGEVLAPDLAARLAGRCRSLWNLYGPTETTIYSCAARIERRFTPDAGQVPIGRPLANTRVYLLDGRHRPVPLGAVGELYIGGSGVARGYQGPADSDPRFMPDPFTDAADARMFRTGDLARYRPDGVLLFLGRDDQQIKLHGVRIEPAEIEACLRRRPEVREAAVIAPTDSEGRTRLIACVVMAKEGERPDDMVLAASLRSHLETWLPRYMIPHEFVQLDALPLTSNAKLDRPALMHRVRGRTATAGGAPRGATETTLAAIWREVLGAEEIDRNDDFFACGGHSLLAMQLCRLSRARGLDLRLEAVFEHPVLRTLAGHATYLASAAVPPVPRPVALFCVPTGRGDCSYVRLLATSLGRIGPVHALDWPHSMTSIEAMAESMCATLRSLQPHGPYRLAGYSSGGLLVHAIAAVLLRTDAVSFAGLIDMPVPAALPGRAPSARRMLLASLVEEGDTAARATFDAAWRSKVAGLRLLELLARIDQRRAQHRSRSVLEDDALQWTRAARFARLVRRYRASRLAVSTHLFQAADASSDSARSDSSREAAPVAGTLTLPKECCT